jgi:hypothetical protein
MRFFIGFLIDVITFASYSIKSIDYILKIDLC